jgi:hypothetical protein
MPMYASNNGGMPMYSSNNGGMPMYSSNGNGPQQLYASYDPRDLPQYASSQNSGVPPHVAVPSMPGPGVAAQSSPVCYNDAFEMIAHQPKPQKLPTPKFVESVPEPRVVKSPQSPRRQRKVECKMCVCVCVCAGAHSKVTRAASPAGRIIIMIFATCECAMHACEHAHVMSMTNLSSRCTVEVDNTFFSEDELQLVRKAGKPTFSLSVSDSAMKKDYIWKHGHNSLSLISCLSNTKFRSLGGPAGLGGCPEEWKR